MAEEEGVCWVSLLFVDHCWGEVGGEVFSHQALDLYEEGLTLDSKQEETENWHDREGEGGNEYVSC